jgi:hypothetical protein
LQLLKKPILTLKYGLDKEKPELKSNHQAKTNQLKAMRLLPPMRLLPVTRQVNLIRQQEITLQMEAMAIKSHNPAKDLEMLDYWM